MVPIAREIRQDLFHLRHHIALIGKGHLAPYLWIDDIAGPAEVHDYHDVNTGVLASSLAKRAPGYASLGFSDPRRASSR